MNLVDFRTRSFPNSDEFCPECSALPHFTLIVFLIGISIHDVASTRKCRTILVALQVGNKIITETLVLTLALCLLFY